jgi:hypothetical protein
MRELDARDGEMDPADAGQRGSTRSDTDSGNVEYQEVHA